MAECPICNTANRDDAKMCQGCGYRFQGESTQQFQAVSVEPEDATAPMPAASVSAAKVAVTEAASDNEKAPVATLTVKNGRQKGMAYPLTGTRAIIGRSPRCEVFLNDMTVSRSHAILERVGDGWSLQDNGSFNGVWINNEPIDHAMLHSGDVIQIGCFVLKFVD